MWLPDCAFMAGYTKKFTLTMTFPFLMMVVSHLNMLEWTDTMYVYWYVQVVGFIKE